MSALQGTCSSTRHILIWSNEMIGAFESMGSSRGRHVGHVRFPTFSDFAVRAVQEQLVHGHW